MLTVFEEIIVAIKPIFYIDVFISYHHNEKNLAEKIWLKLKEQNYRAFYDKDDIGVRLNYNQEWEEKAFRGIKRSAIFIFIDSKYSRGSTPCRTEYNCAEKYKKHFIALVCESLDDDGNWDQLKKNRLFLKEREISDSDLNEIIKAIHAKSAYRNLRISLLFISLLLILLLFSAYLITTGQKTNSELQKSRSLAKANEATAIYLQREAEAQAATATYALGELDRQRLIAEANRISLQGASGQNADIAALLAIYVLNQEYNRQADEALIQSLEIATTREIFEATPGHLSVAFAPDIDVAVIGSSGGRIEVWPTGKIFQNNGSSIECLAFSPDNSSIAIGSKDGSIRIWDTGRVSLYVQITTLNKSPVSSVAFSLDGSLIASGSQDGSVRIWDTKGAFVREFTENTSPTNSIAFSPDGSLIVSGHDDALVRFWDVQNGNPVEIAYPSEYEHKEPVSVVEFFVSSDGIVFLLTGSQDGTIRLWKLENSSMIFIREFVGHNDWITDATFSPDGKYILSSSRDLTVRLWDTQNGREIRTFSGHKEYVTSIAFSPDGRTIITGSIDGTARSWNVFNQSPLPIYDGDGEEYINSVAISPDGKEVLTGGTDYMARLWGIDNTTSPTEFRGHSNYVHTVAFSPNEDFVLTTSWDNSAILWDKSGNQICEFPNINPNYDPEQWDSGIQPDVIGSLSDKHILIIGSIDRTATIYDYQCKKVNGFSLLVGHSDIIHAVAYSPDGKYFVTGGRDTNAIIWDSAGGTIHKILHDHAEGIISIDYSKDGNYIVTGSEDGTARLWETNTNSLYAREMYIFEANGGTVTGVAISEDGRYVVTGHQDGVGRIWEGVLDNQGRLAYNSQDLFDYHIIRHLTGHLSPITDVAMSDDGQNVVTSSRDGTARKWDTDYRQLISSVCKEILKDQYPIYQDDLRDYGISESPCK